VSTGAGDLGGVSYGTYQFSSKTGGVQEFLANTIYGKEFEGLTPGTSEFNAKWKDLAKDPSFGQAQHDFIRGKYYDVQMRRLKQAGFDLSTFGPAVQDDIWSTAVQLRGLTLTIVKGALTGQDWKTWTDAQMVTAIQDYKYDHTQTLFSKSPTLWSGLEKRARSEKGTLLALAATTGGPTQSVPGSAVAMSKGTTNAPPDTKATAQQTAAAPAQGIMMQPPPATGNTVIKGPKGVLIAVNA
jgi:hypothetical protein